MDLESSFEGFVILWLRIDFSKTVVAGDEDALRSKLDTTSFGLCRKGVLVCPLFQVVPTDLTWA